MPKFKMQSNPKAREEQEKSVWAWVDGVDDPKTDVIDEENLLDAYRLNFPTHHSPKWRCKKNCRSNPRCYCSLGENQWLVGGQNGSNENGNIANADDSDESEEDMGLERRAVGMPAGLKNLGNTCYVNSFLQIWFHNLPFRQALYKWDPEQDGVERENETLIGSHYRPSGKVASLQALFAMMEFSRRRAVDPNDFIAKLGLDPQVQQDAAEFSKLFISLLESNLSNQNSEEVRTIVQSQFRGRYAYVTKCLKCKRQSKRPSDFYELDLALQGHKTLTDCLDDFLKEEKLEGVNQYFCEGCESTQDAKRSVKLSELPPVLNLQLNRFIFDMQTGRKKKLNSFVQFPEVLDMSNYLEQDVDVVLGGDGDSDAEVVLCSSVYHLTGVLMHVGAEANHGHYIAHIQEPASGQWFKFSDAYVERIVGKNPKLGSENDPLTPTTSNSNSTSDSLSNGGTKRNSNGLPVKNSKLIKVKVKHPPLFRHRPARLIFNMYRTVLRLLISAQCDLDRKNKKNPKSKSVKNKKSKNYKKVCGGLHGGWFVYKHNICVLYFQGNQGSNNAYMLVYTSAKELEQNRKRLASEAAVAEAPTSASKSGSAKKVNGRKSVAKVDHTNSINSNTDLNNSDLPMYLQAFIEQDRRLLDDELKEQLHVKEAKMKEQVSLKTKMRTLYETIPFRDASESGFDFLPMEWLAKFFVNPNAAPAIDTTPCTCAHGRLDLDRIQDVKAVNSKAALNFYREAGLAKGSRKLNSRSLCEICVRNRCRVIKLARSINQDHKVVTEMLKTPINSNSDAVVTNGNGILAVEDEDDESSLGPIEMLYWVGKTTLKRWRSMARENLEDVIAQVRFHDFF